MAKRDYSNHFDNAPCHTANSTKEFLAKRGSSSSIIHSTLLTFPPQTSSTSLS
ncbi:Hypothetical protein FKW44_004840 [Caligus rogercresseyi]|uniref:Uncharacterized protein n=1 Tax=Caligus rogercresseyi TaxID=217165 RepID=A0A7T8KBD2_CALRO|nr:Hypothetical protein FKW44_004840 [Caligus rogercresseyi]